MKTATPRGSYGIDAPGVLWLWGGYTALYATLAALASTVWAAWWWVDAILWLCAIASAGGAVMFLYASRRGKPFIWRRLLDNVDASGVEDVLDLGCGRGLVTIIAALSFPRSTVVGIDLWRSVDQSGNGIEAARANAALNGVVDRVRFDTGDMTTLPYPDGTFDLVTASLSIHNIRDRDGRRRAVDEAVRVLAPGGRILIADIRYAAQYADDLRRAGLEATTHPARWRGWWSGPWMATTTVTASRPAA